MKTLSVFLFKFTIVDDDDDEDFEDEEDSNKSIWDIYFINYWKSESNLSTITYNK